MDDCIEVSEDAEIFSALIVSSGYWQIKVNKPDKTKTANTLTYGLHHFTRMPYGLKITLSFLHLVDIIISSVKMELGIRPPRRQFSLLANTVKTY